ncbi:unnamed protein product [Caenorhabditis bovis]|uniref:Myb-like domain-containing protein n=1 Tax=Caenorhabditis bovis TaxID=2654633 RepID=A0A8S1F9L5_9PELO|nr:unnamed protein product [Caenorhabditis bovis]
MFRRPRLQMKPKIPKPVVKIEKETVEEEPRNEVVQDEPQTIIQEPETRNLPSKQEAVQPEYGTLQPSSFELIIESQKPQQQSYEHHHVHFQEPQISQHPSNGNNFQRNTNGENIHEDHHHAHKLAPPRSRNVSMCDDENILQHIKQKPRKRFTGNEVLDTSKMTIGDLAYWNPKNQVAFRKRERQTSTSSTIRTKTEIDEAPATPKVAAPQVKIGADGRLVIDETSLVMDTNTKDDGIWETVEEGKNQSKITSLSFRNRLWRKGTSWTQKETDLFYEVVRCTGSDFGLMNHYISGRSRAELKAKYNREERTNWAKLSAALGRPSQLDDSLMEKVSLMQKEIEEEARVKEMKPAKVVERERASIEREEERMQKRLIKLNRNIEQIEEKKRQNAEKKKKNQEEQEDILMREEAVRVLMEIKQDERMRKRDRQICANDSMILEREAQQIIRNLIKMDRTKKRKLNDDAKNCKRRAEEEKEKEKETSVEELEIDDDDDDDILSVDDSTSEEESEEDEEFKNFIQNEEMRLRKIQNEEMRRSVEPRQGGKTMNYIKDAKYSPNQVESTVAVAKNIGNMFDASNEDEFDDVPPKRLCAEAKQTPDDEQPEEDRSEKLEEVPSAVTDVIESMGNRKVVRCGTDEDENREERDEEDEQVPSAVLDVVRALKEGTKIAGRQKEDVIEPPAAVMDVIEEMSRERMYKSVSDSTSIEMVVRTVVERMVRVVSMTIEKERVTQGLVIKLLMRSKTASEIPSFKYLDSPDTVQTSLFGYDRNKSIQGRYSNGRYRKSGYRSIVFNDDDNAKRVFDKLATTSEDESTHDLSGFETADTSSKSMTNDETEEVKPKRVHTCPDEAQCEAFRNGVCVDEEKERKEMLQWYDDLIQWRHDIVHRRKFGPPRCHPPPLTITLIGASRAQKINPFSKVRDVHPFAMEVMESAKNRMEAKRMQRLIPCDLPLPAPHEFMSNAKRLEPHLFVEYCYQLTAAAYIDAGLNPPNRRPPIPPAIISLPSQNPHDVVSSSESDISSDGEYSDDSEETKQERLKQKMERHQRRERRLQQIFRRRAVENKLLDMINGEDY